MKQTHMDAAYAFGIAPVVIGFQDSLEVLSVALFSGNPVALIGNPVVVARPGNAGNPA